MNKKFQKVLAFFAVVLFTLTTAAAFAAENFQEVLKKAEKGDATAQHDIGTMYYYGDGVAQDYSEAVKWWRMAAQDGHPLALEALKELGETW